jgi:glycosyltransferase involved in cell wall biosynthesis
MILSDTIHHGNYYSREFNITRSKFKTILVGADPDLFYPIDRDSEKIWMGNDYLKSNFIVGFIGSYLPLQGIQYILECALKLKSYSDIVFEIVGGTSNNPLYNNAVEFVKKHNLKNIIFYDYQPIESLVNFISRSDVQLGIFGESIKTKLVIPNKAYQAIACRKPLITAKSPAISEIFTDNNDILLCKPYSSESLSEKLITLYEDSKLRTKISNNGYNLFKEKCIPKSIGKNILSYLYQLS